MIMNISHEKAKFHVVCKNGYLYLIAMLQANLIWFSAFTVGLPFERKISTDTLPPNIQRLSPVFVLFVAETLKASGV